MTVTDVVETEVEDTVVPSPAVDEPEEVRLRAAQDVRVVNDIRESRRMILKLRELPEAAEMMVKHGYNETKLEEGLRLYQAAFDAFDARSDAMARKQHTSAQLRGAEITAREIYADYKSICRAFFPEEPDWTALAVEGATPRSRNEFILKARDAYVGGQRDPYAEELAFYGFGGETLQQADATIDALEQADAAYRAEIELAKDATSQRDAATEALREWMKKFVAVLEVVLKGHPSLVEILGPAV
jgi:hypothetical protein